MKILYDMGTGMVLEKSRQDEKSIQAYETYLLSETRLQEITPTDYREKQQFPHTLRIDDLKTFLNGIS